MFCECGVGSFKHVDEGPDDLSFSSGSPSKGRRKHGANKVNPYAGRGLDRFSVVLSELETRRAKILRRVVGSDDAAGLVHVRFVQSNGVWTPVIVKLPDRPPLKGAAAAAKKPRAASTTAAPPLLLPPALASPACSPPWEREGVKKEDTKRVPARRAASFSWGRRMRRPSRYWPAVLVLTLVSLAVFGRVFAICLTSIWWYVLPTLGSGGAGAGEEACRVGLRRSMEKKKHVSQLPHAKNGSSWGVHEVASSPRGHANGKRS